MTEINIVNKKNTQLSAREFRHAMRRRSYVSERYKLIYFDTPKVASTSLKWTFAHIEGFTITPSIRRAGYKNEMSIHLRHVHPLPALTDFSTKQSSEMLADKAFKRIGAVRNPYTRLIAGWSDKIRQIEPGNSETCAAISRYHGQDPQTHNPSFREFAIWVLRTNNRETCNLHWRPQSDVLCVSQINYDYIIKTESIGEDLQAIFDSNPKTSQFNAKDILTQYRFNESLPLSYEGLYDEDLAREVAAFYSEDFQRFHYDPDSWKSIRDRKPLTFADLERAAIRAIRQRNQVIEMNTMKTRKKLKRFFQRMYRNLFLRDTK